MLLLADLYEYESYLFASHGHPSTSGQLSSPFLDPDVLCISFLKTIAPTVTVAMVMVSSSMWTLIVHVNTSVTVVNVLLLILV